MENCWENAEKRQKALWALEGAKAPNRCQKCKKMPNGAEWSRMEPNGSEKAESCQQMANAAGK